MVKKERPQSIEKEQPLLRSIGNLQMNTVKHLQKARAKRTENARSGTKPLNPIQKAKQNPKSRVFAIVAFCYDCMGQDSGWRNDVRNCTAPECPLFGFRPYEKNK